MPKRDTNAQRGMAAYMHRRASELLDAVITAAAMVAQADGRIDPIERSQLLAFLNGSGLLAIFTRDEVLDAFEDRSRQIAGSGGANVAISALRRLAGRSLARLVINAGMRVAVADGRIHPRELRAMALIRMALRGYSQSLESWPRLSRLGG